MSLSPAELAELRDPGTVSVRLSLAQHALEMGATAVYEAARQGELAPGLPVIKCGRVYRVAAAPLRRLLGLEA